MNDVRLPPLAAILIGKKPAHAQYTKSEQETDVAVCLFNIFIFPTRQVVGIKNISFHLLSVLLLIVFYRSFSFEVVITNYWPLRLIRC